MIVYARYEIDIHGLSLKTTEDREMLQAKLQHACAQVCEEFFAEDHPAPSVTVSLEQWAGSVPA